jgi:small subunit ribosomal protein S16
MGVKIRLARHGTKKRPFYRIVVTDSEAPRDGKFLEKVGTYNPAQDPAAVELEAERIRYWIDKGAVPTDTVKNLLRREGFYAKTA